MSLKGPDNPLLCHYFCYYLKWVYDNAMFTTGDTLTYSYGGLGEESSDLQSLRAKRGQGLRLLHCFPISGHRLGLLYIISILIHGGQTSYELRLQPLNPTQHWSRWRSWGFSTPVWGPRRSTCLDLPRDLVLKRLSRLNLLGDPPVPVVPGACHASTCPGTQFSGGCHALTCPGIRSLGGCHASACLGICILTRGCLAVRLQQYWVG